jgi:DNA polymerase-1
MGRRRYIPGIYEKNRNLFDAAKRVAINTKAQGTAAEIMKLAMVNLNSRFEELGQDSKIILQIHDELLISVPESKLQETELEIKNILESVVAWNVPLKVTTRSGKDWAQVTK